MALINTFTAPVAPQWRARTFTAQHPYVRNPKPILATETGPLAGLEGRDVLVLVDVENLTISARKLGYELNYTALAQRLSAAARAVQLHAALSIEPRDTVDTTHMIQAGFTIHTRVIERLPDGTKAANSDNVLAFQTGLLVSRTRADVVILGSGDGQLVCDLANSIRELPAKRTIHTLSIPGATSSRLDSRRNKSIETNVEIGVDVLVGFADSRRLHAK